SNEENIFFKILEKVPGFRTNNIKKGFVASFMYIAYVKFIIERLEVVSGVKEFISDNLIFLLITVVPMWWFGNNGKEWERLSFIKNKDEKDKLSYAVLVYIVFFFIIGYISVKILG
ncbi:MAG: hypothetical protein ACI4VF_03245, partial [Lachnospirales bacterium]